MIKNFLSDPCIKDSLERLSTVQWSDQDEYIPLRVAQDIDLYPMLKEELVNKIGNDFYIKDRIHFVQYPPKTKSPIHPDPCNYTLIVILQRSEFGGNLMFEGNISANIKSPGDAILFEGNRKHFVTEVISGTRIALAVWLNSVPDQYKIMRE